MGVRLRGSFDGSVADFLFAFAMRHGDCGYDERIGAAIWTQRMIVD
jgi:hypothetical protein